MKIKSLLIGMLACTALVGCNNEDVVENNEQTVATKDKAYVVVNIMSSNDPGSRGLSNDPPFYYGSADENEVKHADFFFYDANGEFVIKSRRVEAEFTDNGNNAETEDHVESISTCVAVLEGLTGTNFPSYVFAVLNASDDLVERLINKDLNEAQAILAKTTTASAEGNNGIINKIGGKDYFIMSNSSFVGTGADYANVATKVEPKHFLTETPTKTEMTDDNVVTLYVERLAAKVEVKLANGLNLELGKYTVDNTEKTLKLTVKGWALNATNKDSYIIKNIDEWADDKFTDFSWNDPTKHRSYWGKSINYGGGTYPTSYGSTVQADGTSNINTYTLNYVNYDEMQPLTTTIYCAENTNTTTILSSRLATKATSVLLSAVVADETGSPIDLIRFDNVLYTEDNYKARVLNKLQMSYWTANADNTGRREIAKTDLQIKKGYDGTITLELTDAAEALTWYANKTATENEASTATTTINELLAGDNVVANYYEDGQMYYNIPIEHLENADELAEGEYGVVRNHYYIVTITKIENLGSAVHTPGEEIVPNEKETTYYVGAKINILSWKIVNQSASL